MEQPRSCLHDFEDVPMSRKAFAHAKCKKCGERRVVVAVPRYSGALASPFTN